MSSMTFGQKTFTPTPPEKGSFPLDHEGLCKTSMLRYMICLRENNNDNSQCRKEAKDYLNCRMENSLMVKEEWSKLGFSEVDVNSQESNKKLKSHPTMNDSLNEESSCPSPIKKRHLLRKKHLLIGCTGSVATIKLPEIIEELKKVAGDSIEIRVVVTQYASHFFKLSDLPSNTEIFKDEDEWKAWTSRGDPVLHIELGKWADLMVIAPLDANTLAKIAQGLCDNLLTCVVRAWDMKKSLLFCPAMNTRMWDHPITLKHISVLKSWGYQEIPPISKTLMCGDKGVGAMAEVSTIIQKVQDSFANENFSNI